MSGKRVAVFGSGRVARPAIRTLADTGHVVVVATDQPDVARELLDGCPGGTVAEVDATNDDHVRSVVEHTDLSISLLPVHFHVRVAEVCVALGRPFVTTSYVSEEMRALDGAARRAGVLLLNEIGADPGIDHMQAMRMIHRVVDEGGRITGLRSVCGGIPSPEANDNPFGYKLSWSPRGVVLAGRRPARYLVGGRVVHVEPFGIFDHPSRLEVAGLGEVETYPNGDSIRFEEEYGLSDLDSMFRGSIRWPGWCETWSALCRLGWVDDAPDAALAGSTWAQEMLRSVGGADGDDPRRGVAARLDRDPSHPVLERFEWLGLFSRSPVPAGARSRADLLVARMEEKLLYRPGERDLLVLHHEVEYEDSHGRPGRLLSDMTEYGVPGGDSAMSRAVGIPAALAARRILDGTIRETGVQIPVQASIYGPILGDLEDAGIHDDVRGAHPSA